MKSILLLVSCLLPFAVHAMEMNRWDTQPVGDTVNSETGGVVTGSTSNRPPTPPPGCFIRNGLYGSETPNTDFVDFVAQVEVDPSAVTTSTIIFALEVAFAEAILPTLFPGCPTSTSSTARSGDVRRRLKAVGVSTLPVDEILDGVKCEPETMVDGGNTCFILDSVFTIFTDGNDSNEAATALSIIKQKAGAGEFDNAHSDIVKVQIVNLSPDGSEGSGTGGGGNTNPNGRVGVAVYASVAAGVLLVIAAAVFYRRRRQQSHVDSDSTVLTPPAVVAPTETGATPGYDMNSIS